MPWRVQPNHPDCPASKPYGVVKKSDGKLAGCHESMTKAREQQKALYANTNEGKK